MTRAVGPLGRRPQLSEEVAAYVRELIMSGQVRAGDFLRLEHLAGELGISVTPVREALLALRGEGFVHLEPRRGFQVASLSRQDVEDVFGVQADVAAELAARAAARVTDDDLGNLWAIQEAMSAAARDGDVTAIEEHNHRFHRDVHRIAQAHKLAWVLGNLVHYAPRRFYGRIDGWPRASVEDHHAILAALAARDPSAARTAMRTHIEHAGALLVAHLAAQGLWDSGA